MGSLGELGEIRGRGREEMVQIIQRKAGMPFKKSTASTL